MALSSEELERYARHIVLRDIGGAGQMRLREATVLVVGAGGLGSPALLYLAAAGVGALRVVDDDSVSLSNLQRQVLHGTPDVGAAKTASAARALARLNPESRVEARCERFEAGNADSLLEGCDAVLDGSDSFATRDCVNAAAARLRVPLVSGAIGLWDGVLTVLRPWRGGPCWRCLNPEPPAEGSVPSCAEAGVLGALAGAVGSLMAAECVKLLAGAGEPVENRMLLADALHGEWRMVATGRRPDCPVCGESG